MFEKLQNIDHWILDNIYQKFADWIWEIAPVSCFVLAKISLVITCMLGVACRPEGIGFGFSICLSLILFTTNYLYISISEKTYNKKFLNKQRDSIWSLRLMSLSIGISQVLLIPLDGFSYFLLAGSSVFYFLACQQRPPIERYSRALNGILS